MLAWMMRMWWEFTRPITPIDLTALPAAKKPNAPQSKSSIAVAWILMIALVAMLLNIVLSVDFTQDASWVFLEFLKRTLWLCALAGGSLLAILRSIEKPAIDERPAPWVLYGLIVAVGVFLIHNLIEFSLFEPGTMCLFGLLAGAILGVRHSPIAGPRRPSVAPLTALALSVTAIVAGLLGFIIPTALAEASARAGDELLRNSHFEDAEHAYQRAYDEMPINADYAFRAARALEYEGDIDLHSNAPSKVPPSWEEEVRSLYSIASSRNPSDVRTYLSRAHFALQYRDTKEVISDFEKALELNPNEVSIRLQYADAMKALNRPEIEKRQLRLALDYNSRLDAEEPKRLSSEEIDGIDARLKVLGMSPTSGSAE
jgi:hypothetical protein